MSVHLVEIVGFVVSPGHAYGGRPSDGPAPVVTHTPDTITVRAGHGVVGDRYAGRLAHRDAAVTVLAIEALDAVADELGRCTTHTFPMRLPPEEERVGRRPGAEDEPDAPGRRGPASRVVGLRRACDGASRARLDR